MSGASEASAAAGNEGVVVRVDPSPDARGWQGQVTIAGPRALEREVRGERCEDVVAALALITVLRLEGGDTGDEGNASGDVSAAGASDAATAGAGAAAAGSRTATSPASPQGEAASAPAASTAPAASAPSAATAPAPAPAAPSTAPDATARAEPAPTDDRSPTPDASDEAPEPAASTRAESALPDSDDDGSYTRDSRANQPEPPESIAREQTESEPAPPSADNAAPGGEAEQASNAGSWPATSFGLAALAGYATVPSQAFRGALDAELRWGEGTSAWLSSLSLGYAHGDHSVAPSDLGLTLLTLELGLCPPAFVAEPSVWVSACASVRGGAVRLSFSATDAGVEARDTWRPWLALAPALRAGVPLSERWALRGVAQLAVQLVRDTYTVGITAPDDPEPQTLRLYRPEAVSVELGAGIGYSF